MHSVSAPSAHVFVLAFAAAMMDCGPAAVPTARSALTPAGYGFASPALSSSQPSHPAPPLSLTSSDGSGLRLVELTARAVVQDPLALTELHLVFANPEARTREGTFSITLPEGAAISRFAMRIGDAWQEGEVVEQKRARLAYEDFLHRKQDPALLEQAAGNQFSARVFPIPANGRKELIVSYSEELVGDRSYVLPLRGLPSIDKLDALVTVAGSNAAPLRIAQTSVTPSADLELSSTAFVGHGSLRNGNLVVTKVRPRINAALDPLAATLILVDTSASRALGFEDELVMLQGLARRIAETAGQTTPLAVACYDQEVVLIFDGNAGSFGDREIQHIRERDAFGASNLSAALSWTGTFARAHGTKRVLVLGDGVATAGAVDADEIGHAASLLRSSGVDRLDAVVMGGIRDEGVLRRLPASGLPRDGVVVEGHLSMPRLMGKLTQTAQSGIRVRVEGATWWWPEVLDSVQPGDEALVFAEVNEREVRVGLENGATERLDPVNVERPMLARAVARAKIASLLLAEGASKDPTPLRRAIVELSVHNRVLSPYTSMLVLETQRDFDRFGIDRKALADILTIDGGIVAVARRSAPPVGAAEGREVPAQVVNTAGQASSTQAHIGVEAPEQPRPLPSQRAANVGSGDVLAARGQMWGSDIGDSFGAGGLGLSGIGEGGSGRGEGSALE